LKSQYLPSVASLNDTVTETKNLCYLTPSDAQYNVPSSHKQDLGPCKLKWKQDTKKRVLLKILRIMNDKRYSVFDVQVTVHRNKFL